MTTAAAAAAAPAADDSSGSLTVRRYRRVATRPLTGNRSTTTVAVIGPAQEDFCMMHLRRALRLIPMLLIAAGCHTGKPLIPQGWSVVRTGPVARAKESDGHLKLIICYGAGLSNHAAVRIESPPGEPLFWDPGGRFGTVPPLHERVRCVVLGRPPTLEQYWHFRTDFCAERWMEVFEWDLPADEAKRLRTILCDGSAGRGGFDTDYVGLACAVGVSDFLRYSRAAGIRLGDWYFLPHSLAAVLWCQHPTRVWEYRLNDGILCVTPPPNYDAKTQSSAQ